MVDAEIGSRSNPVTTTTSLTIIIVLVGGVSVGGPQLGSCFDDPDVTSVVGPFTNRNLNVCCEAH